MTELIKGVLIPPYGPVVCLEISRPSLTQLQDSLGTVLDVLELGDAMMLVEAESIFLPVNERATKLWNDDYTTEGGRIIPEFDVHITVLGPAFIVGFYKGGLLTDVPRRYLSLAGV